jgi:hypothetical protein
LVGTGQGACLSCVCVGVRCKPKASFVRFLGPVSLINWTIFSPFSA